MPFMIVNNLWKTPSVWIVVVLVLAAELTVRFSLPAGKVPKGAYHSSEFRQQVEHYRKAIPIDMLIIGSSVAAANYPPVPLDERLRELGLKNFTSYNAGIRGCNYSCIAKGVRRHYWSEYQPAWVLVTISTADLNIDNAGVVARSDRFAADMERSVIGRAGRQMLSGFSHLYGFKEEVREWLTSGEWIFDPAVLGERGYVDLGSKELRRIGLVPQITVDSDLSRSLITLVDELANSGAQVILLPVDGGSLARSLFSTDARAQLRVLMDTMTSHPNVNELVVDTTQIPDTDYIDTVHLKSAAAIENAQRLAESLIELLLTVDQR